MYKAAGILPLALNEQDDKVYMLLGSEPRRASERKKGEKYGDVWWLGFGGKIEASDQGQSHLTALREFHEESGGMFPDDPVFLSEPAWDPRAKYMFYVGQVPFTRELPSFTDEQARVCPTLNKRTLRWVPVSALAFLSPRGFDLKETDEFLPVKMWYAVLLYRERKRIVEAANKLVRHET